MERQPIVAKFGGTSMATAERIASVAEIIKANPQRQFVVVSAPGKHSDSDIKITDQLLLCHDLISIGLPFGNTFDSIASRYETIGQGLACYESVGDWIQQVKTGISQGESRDWIASRGEWLMAKVLSRYIGFEFTDAADMIKLRPDGTIHPKTYQMVSAMLKNSSAFHVIPGFYGQQEANASAVKIFARGGSDITGAIIAREVGAQVYENWTDINGLQSADPRLIPRAKFVPEITYWEMRELGNNGVPVLQRDTIAPVFQANIPINIRNTFQSGHEGTMVLPKRNSSPEEEVIAIASRSGYLSVQIRKFGINEQPGYIGVIADALAETKVSIEHIPTGADMMTLIIDRAQIQGDPQKVVDTIIQAASPDELKVHPDIGLICLVGQQATQRLASVISKASGALKRSGILIESVSAPQGGDSILLGVNSRQTSRAVETLYQTFIKGQG